MEIQIDIKKPDEGFTSSQVNLYIDGECFVLGASLNTVEQLLKSGIIKKTQRWLRNETTGKKECYDYVEGCDGMGVKYTTPILHAWADTDAPHFEFDQENHYWLLLKNGSLYKKWDKLQYAENEASAEAYKIVKEANQELPRLECKFTTNIPIIQ